ncbi:transposase [Aliiroseovarius sp. xm-m-378]|uniref:transposase n=1 Tax=unclassified Aliiroseovarius TaxID=2623558 RepID=UPI001569EEA8|nr:hypothetical protein [Aliiroseovarius sp. xm-m-314]NRP44713.1 hypothetical protein [Aliiroseovarius sp. xm-m-378]NRP50649.1 hypothetical protein [Aliiroseovarius sp. xm-m-354]NRP65584.1 hypothetical protein [Aliiroseovarius sp. xm-v-225]NRP80541.1 hypothetical protein [Aliiroseovarius sp. xm-v-209]NRP92886.1 hypothetical protein [Aliiroseovarius sp. xm-a-134]NRQ05401.1 hypothetical protein [Aliiroseovarius sp. xm-m-309]NRQ08606.1 hypothetical protein [Aliiroseovarius sp. xm-v-201]NRQ1204
MKTSFTDEQIMQMLKEQEAGERTADVCRRYALPGRVLHSNIPRGGLARARSTNTNPSIPVRNWH